MVATPDFLFAAQHASDARVAQVRAGAAVRAVGQGARSALRALMADLDRAARLHLMPPGAVRLLDLHRSLRRPGLTEVPDRIDALLELVDDIPEAAMAVGLDGPRKRRMAARAASLRTALVVRRALAS